MVYSQDSPERQEIVVHMYVCMYEENNYEDLAHTIMEAEKSHNLLSECWRPRKDSAIIWFKFRGLRTRKGNGLNPSTWTEEHRCPSSTSKGSNSFFRCVFYSDPLQTGRGSPPRGGLSTEFIDSNANLIWKNSGKHSQKLEK